MKIVKIFLLLLFFVTTKSFAMQEVNPEVLNNLIENLEKIYEESDTEYSEEQVEKNGSLIKRFYYELAKLVTGDY